MALIDGNRVFVFESESEDAEDPGWFACHVAPADAPEHAVLAAVEPFPVPPPSLGYRHRCQEYRRHEPNASDELEHEKARADRAEQENKRLGAWCGRLGSALAGVQDATRGRFPTPRLDSILSEFAEVFADLVENKSDNQKNP